MIQPIQWTVTGILLLDQRRLPAEERYVTCRTVDEVAEAIRALVVRGAPAIAITAALGIAREISQLSSGFEISEHFGRSCRILRSTRPTARNLFWAIERMERAYESVKEKPLMEIQEALFKTAQQIHQMDIETNRRIGSYGQALLADGSRVLTHCNTGALATGGYGTALGIVRAAVEGGKHIRVIADETRPFLQGARLTAWEMKQEGIPCTLITDNMAGHFMRLGEVDAVIVGADRVARNGDVANKIGTYTLAVLAKEHQIPFYVAVPLSTIDLETPSGNQIPIEERDPVEVSEFNGKRICPEGIDVRNPAFDITPAALISAIITDVGIARPPYSKSIESVVQKGGMNDRPGH